jgi:hypothetical protein
MENRRGRRWPGAFKAVPCAAALAFATQAHAEGDNRAVAEALFAKGRDAAARGDLATACSAFEESERLDPAPGTMFNLGDCEEKRGHIASAWQWFAEAVTKLPANDDRRALVQSRAASLKARLPMLAIRLEPGVPAGTKVLRDSIELGAVSLGASLPTDPGTHRVIVSAPGRVERRLVVELSEGEQKELVVGPGAEVAPQVVTPPPAATPPPLQTKEKPAPSPGHDTKLLGYAIGGAGVAGIGTALILGGVALGKKSTVDEHCDKSNHTCDSQSAVDAASTGSTLSTVSTVAFIVGAAAAGVGAYFILSSGPSSETSVHANAGLGGGDFRLVHRF